MILHVANLDKFIPPFVSFVNENFLAKNHLFHLYGDDKAYKINQTRNVIITRKSIFMSIVHHIKLVPKLLRAKKIFVHGLFDIKFIILLVLMPFVLKKCYWVIWGGDLYQYQTPKTTLKDRLKESLRAFVIKRFGFLVTYIPGDIELARTWYGAKGEYLECLMYLSNVVDSRLADEVKFNKRRTKTINILVGNSADPSNNHFEVLDTLTKFKDEDIEIFVPLSYGNQEYANALIDYGSKLFGNMFKPITEFMCIEDYKQFLGTIDIGIFNHKRQQAMGNTIYLLGIGAAVYLVPDLPHSNYLKSKGFVIQNLKDFEIIRLSTYEREINMNKIQEVFNRDNLISQLKRIFYGD